ncbi:MAG: ribosome biogenesis GTP-binding protein YihA/YsxC [Deltaproteobacteria bacterium]|jgi:GTP-binding protein|nr:ribosome biogenesis GTP-binding protein YihA/YsxC [Deltaproteobacteria bacterium]
MKVLSAEFVKSATKPSEYPPGNLPEVAIAGKSNVGKSSLINTLVNRKNLAKTSSEPGRTQTLNFFRVNEKLSLVDLPGYGFAKAPLEARRAWKPMVETYLQTREAIRLVILILDSRRGMSPEDSTLLDWLEYHEIPALIVLTKADKLSQFERARQKKGLAAVPLLEGRPLLFFSALTGEGKDEVWSLIQKSASGDAGRGDS